MRISLYVAGLLVVAAVTQAKLPPDGPRWGSSPAIGETPLPDTTAPTFTVQPTGGTPTATSQTFSWQTSERTTSVIECGDNAVPGVYDLFTVDLFDAFATVHTDAPISDLTPEFHYYCRVIATDEVGLLGYSDEVDFTTADIGDVTAPTLANFQVYDWDATPTTMRLQWTTLSPPEAADTRALCTQDGGSTGGPYDGHTYYNATMTHFHNAYLTGLTPDTQYWCIGESTDAAGNKGSTSGEVTFTTDAVADTTPPNFDIGLALVGTPTSTTARFDWTTDEGSDSLVACDETSGGEYVDVVGALRDAAPLLVLYHDYTIGGLTPDTTYYCQATSKDQSLNSATNGNVTVVTPAAPSSAVSLGDLDIAADLLFKDTDADGTDDALRWRAFDTTVYDWAQANWTRYDATCTIAQETGGFCASGYPSYQNNAGMSGCSVVTTAGTTGWKGLGCMTNGRTLTNGVGGVSETHATQPTGVILMIPDGTYSNANSNIDHTTGNWQISAINPMGVIVNNLWDGLGGSGTCSGAEAPALHYVCNPSALSAGTTVWTGGYTKGEDTITAPGHGLSIGDEVILSMTNNTVCEHFQRRPNQGQQNRATWHHSEVASVNGNDVVINDPLPLTYVGVGCNGHTLRKITYNKHMGFTGINFRNDAALTNSGANPQAERLITFLFAKDFWFVGNAIQHIDRQYATTSVSEDGWIQGNYFNDMNPGLRSSTEGWNLKKSAVHIVMENNNSRNTTVTSKIEVGTGEIIFGYNYTTNTQQLTDPFAFCHGYRSFDCLFEGNSSHKRIETCDRWWGENGGVCAAYANRLFWNGNECHAAANLYLGGDDPGQPGENGPIYYCSQDGINPGTNCVDENDTPDFTFSADDDAVFIANMANTIMISPRTADCATTPAGLRSVGDGGGRSFRNVARRTHLEFNVMHHPSIVGLSNHKPWLPGTINLNEDNEVSASVAPAGNYPTGWDDVVIPVSLYHQSRPSWWPSNPPTGVCSWGTTQPSVGAFVDDWNSGLEDYCELPTNCYWDAYILSGDPADLNTECSPF